VANGTNQKIKKGAFTFRSSFRIIIDDVPCQI
jgi:hypothetical protein